MWPCINLTAKHCRLNRFIKINSQKITLKTEVGTRTLPSKKIQTKIRKVSFARKPEIDQSMSDQFLQ